MKAAMVCDYSLMANPSRRAVSGDELVVRRFAKVVRSVLKDMPPLSVRWCGHRRLLIPEHRAVDGFAGVADELPPVEEVPRRQSSHAKDF